MDIKLRAGRYMIPATITEEGSRLFVKFGYNKLLLDEIKSMEGAKWHGFDDPNPKKVWSIANTFRNWFQLKYLMGENPYARFDRDLSSETWKTDRPMYEHQKKMAIFGYHMHFCILACEMGTGKTLAAIEIAEKAGVQTGQLWYVGPRAGVTAVGRELIKWDCKIKPYMLTYEGLVSELKNWNPGDKAPRMVIFDESSKIKTPTAQRSQAARKLADSIREEYKDDGYVILMSGTPAPKEPTDWWHACEVAYPGFIKEGNPAKFKARLCIIEQRESITGGVYPHLITWLDDENKCAVCGKLEYENPAHRFDLMESGHKFVKSANEVQRLYKRMSGLVLVQFKKDCLDLPEKRYEIVQIKASAETIRTAKLITKTSPRAITALTLLRELSDGFQYGSEKVGEDICVCALDGSPNPDCDLCGGEGTIPQYARTIENVESPKDQYFIDDLDQHEDIGRYVVWGGFTGTVDRLTIIAHKQGWATLRIDGRGYLAETATGEKIDPTLMFNAMDRSHQDFKNLLTVYPKVCVVGNAGAGGMAHTFTASPTMLFYSNSFNGEYRMQAEDRCHRIGMDTNKGLVIKDLIHLSTDQLILDNLKQKKKLQLLSMGELAIALDKE